MFVVKGEIILRWVGEAGEVSVGRDICESFGADTSSKGWIESALARIRIGKDLRRARVCVDAAVNERQPVLNDGVVVQKFATCMVGFNMSNTRARNEPNIQFPPWKQVRWLEVR